MKGKTKAATGEAPVKTSIKLDRGLWKRAHVRAMDEGVDLQDLIAKALEAYLKAGSR
jgi:fructose-bisphosphate aldolase class 1